MVRAAHAERLHCDGAAVQDRLDVLATTPILRVEPIYSHIFDAAHAIEKQVIGAKLVVRPPPGERPDQLSQVLQCRAARAVLGRVHPTAVGDEPFFLPDAWVDIAVVSEGGNYAVSLTADTVTDNLRILARARHYASERAIATGAAP